MFKPLVYYGDSITAGVPVTPAYSTLLNTALGVSAVNRAGSGAQAMDMSWLALQNGSAPSSDTVIMLGVNDVNNGVTLARREAYIKFMRSLIVRCACPNVNISRVSGVTFSGTWTNYGVNAQDVFGKLTNQVGATATATTSGKAVYIGIRSMNAAGTGGTFEVLVDGVSKGLFTADGTTHGTSGNGLIHSPMAFYIGGLSDTSHTVVVKHVSGGQTMLDYIAGSGQTVKPNVFVGNITPIPTKAADVTAFNAELTALLNEFTNDGLNVFFVDAASGVSGQFDNLHPNQASHVTIKDRFYSVINGLYNPVNNGFTGTRNYNATVNYVDGHVTNISFGGAL